MEKPDRPAIPQAGVIPYRRSPSGLPEVLLVSSRSHGWIFPKGHIEPLVAAADMGAMEAFEEAGVRGRVDYEPLGVWSYEKHGSVYEVEFFALQVQEILDQWPEQRRRRRRWVTLNKASNLVSVPELRELVRQLKGHLGADGRLASAS